MTQAERLIRNLCDDTRRSINQDKDRETSDDAARVPRKDWPLPVRRAVDALRSLAETERKHRQVIKGAGFDVPDTDEPVTHLNPPYKERATRKSAGYKRAQDRTAVVQRLQADAIVKTLGKKGGEARTVLEQLQKDLAKV